MGGLNGTVRAPSTIIGLNDAGIIGLNDAGIIGLNDAGLFGKTRVDVVSNNGGNYRLQALASQVPLKGVPVRLLDAAGKPVAGPDGRPLETRTNERGGYSFPAGLPARGLRVVVDLGKLGRLQALAARDRKQPTVDVDLVSTLTSTYIVDRYVVPQVDPLAALDRLPEAAEAATREKARATLATGRVAMPNELAPARLGAVVVALQAADAGFAAQLEVVRRLLVIGAATNSATDGPALEAAIDPVAMTVDRAGNVYFLDAGGSLMAPGGMVLRVLRTDGRVVTLAGRPDRAASVDGKGDQAAFGSPYSNGFTGGLGMTTDAAGNVYVAEADSATIRRVTPDGTVTTIAGQLRAVGETAPAVDGPRGLATFSRINGLAIDPRGNFLVLDERRLRRVSPDGTVTTIAGNDREPVLLEDGGAVAPLDGQGAAATFNWPHALAVDPAGNAIVVDSNGFRKITPDGVVSTLGVPRPESGSSLSGLVVDAAGNIFFNSMFEGILKAVPGGGISTHVPADRFSSRLNFIFSGPSHGLVAGPAGALYFNFNQQIWRASPDGRVEAVAGLGQRAADGQAERSLFRSISSMAWAGGEVLYVGDRGYRALRRVAADGRVSTVVENDPDRLSFFQGMAADAAGNVYFSDSGVKQIFKVMPDGKMTPFAGVADMSHSYSNMIGGGISPPMPPEGPLPPDPSGPPPTPPPAPTVPEYVDGAGAMATFLQPGPLAIDGAGNLYMPDAFATYGLGSTWVIRKIAPDGHVSTVPGSKVDDGSWPSGAIAVDPAGNIYTIGAGVIRKLTPAGVTSILAGDGPAPDPCAYTDGPPPDGANPDGPVGVPTPCPSSPPRWRDGRGSGASFENLVAMVVDAAGNLLVLDIPSYRFDVARVRKVTPEGTVTTIKEIDVKGQLIAPALAINPTTLTYAVGGQIFNIPLPR